MAAEYTNLVNNLKELTFRFDEHKPFHSEKEDTDEQGSHCSNLRSHRSRHYFQPSFNSQQSMYNLSQGSFHQHQQQAMQQQMQQLQMQQQMRLQMQQARAQQMYPGSMNPYSNFNYPFH